MRAARSCSFEILSRDWTKRCSVPDAKVVRDFGEPWIGRPQCDVGHERRGEQVRVDPTDPAAVQTPLACELDYLLMRNNRNLLHACVVREQARATALVTDEKLAEDEVVACDFALQEQPIELTCVGGAIGQESNPDRRVDEDHHGAGCFPVAVDARRRPTSLACGSLPRSARIRSLAAWRTSASSPSRTASVSLRAPLADLASRRRLSSMWSVFFMPYDHGIIVWHPSMAGCN